MDVSVPRLLSKNVVSGVFPLHCQQDLMDLQKKWVLAFRHRQPLGENRKLILNSRCKGYLVELWVRMVLKNIYSGIMVCGQLSASDYMA